MAFGITRVQGGFASLSIISSLPAGTRTQVNFTARTDALTPTLTDQAALASTKDMAWNKPTFTAVTSPQPFVTVALVEDSIDPLGDFKTAGGALTAGVTEVRELGQVTAQNAVMTTLAAMAYPNKVGTVRMVISFGESQATATRKSAGAYGATSTQYHIDTDVGNNAIGSVANVTMQAQGVDATFTGRAFRAAILTNLSSSIVGNQGYSKQPTLTVTLAPAGGTGTVIMNPKPLKLTVRKNSDLTRPADWLFRPTPSATTGVATSTAYNIDTDFPASAAAYDVIAGINDAFADATTPAGEFSHTTAQDASGLDSHQKGWVIFATTGHTSPIVSDGGTFGRTPIANPNLLTISSDIVASSVASYFETARTTAKSRWKRKSIIGSTSDNNGANVAHPFLRCSATDGFGVALSAVSLKTHVVKTGTVTPDLNLQTIVSGSGATAGRVDWEMDIATTEPAGNRFKKTSPDQPSTPAAGSATSGTTTSLTDTNKDFVAANVHVGDYLFTQTNPGAGQYLLITSVATHVLGFASAVSVGTGTAYYVTRPVFVQRDVFLMGNAYAGVREPTSASAVGIFGVNSEILFQGMWTGDSSEANVDPTTFAPTGIIKRTKNLASGKMYFKVCSLLDEGAGSLFDATQFNPRDAQGGLIDLRTTQVLRAAFASYNLSKGVQEDPAVVDASGVELDAPLGYSNGNSNIGGGQHGFIGKDTTGDGRTLALYLAYCDDQNSPGEATTFTLDAISPESAGFTTDAGNYGYFRQVVDFTELNNDLGMEMVADNVLVPPSTNVRLTLRVFKNLPNQTRVGVKPDAAPTLYIDQNVSLGSPLANVLGDIIQQPMTAVNPDGNGMSADWEYVFTPPSNGTFAAFSTCQVKGSRPPGGANAAFKVGTRDENIQLVTGAGNTQSTGMHIVAGEYLTVGLAIVRVDTKKLVFADAGTTKVIIIRQQQAGANAGRVEYLDSDNTTWVRLDATATAYQHALVETIPGVSGVYVKTFTGTQTALWGSIDIFTVGQAQIAGITYTDKAQDPITGKKNRHDKYAFDGTAFATGGKFSSK